MAGETRGELAEAIAKVALDLAVNQQGKGYKVFWEERPANSVIKPDLTVGPTKDHLINLVLVNASDSVKESEKKYWRNIGEIFDSKSRLTPPPLVLNLVFKSEIKPELINLTAALCDSTHLVDKDPIHGTYISLWLEKNHASAPSAKTQKEVLVRNAITHGTSRYDADFSAAVQHLSKKLRVKLQEHRKDLSPLWEVVRQDFASRRDVLPRSARITVLRRGLARWLVFGDDIRHEVFRAQFLRKSFSKEKVPPYAETLGMLESHINGAYIPAHLPQNSDMVSTTASDLRIAVEFYKQASGEALGSAYSAFSKSLSEAPEEMLRAAHLLRDMPARVSSWHKYVVTNWASIITPLGCYKALMACRTDPTLGGAVGAQDERRVWLYDHLIAILRATAGRNNDFGYGALTSYFKSRREDTELNGLLANVISGLDRAAKRKAQAWVLNTLPRAAEPGRRGFQDWLAGNKNLSPVIVAAFSYSLSKLLSEVTNPRGISVNKLVAAHAYGLWNKLLTHQDFEPLLELILAAGDGKLARLSAPTIMVDLASRAVQNAGRILVLQANGTLVYWKSCYGSHVNDKRKELVGRAWALRLWSDGSRFAKRKGVDKLLLVLDGEWRDEDLRILAQSGWDHIFYADEMDKLIKAIENNK